MPSLLPPSLFTMFQDDLTSPSSNGHSNGTPSQTPSPTTDTPATTCSRPSSSRALVPTPLSTNLTPKVAIATASSPSSDFNPSPVGGGPTSTSYVVPPRPKPGRKPATDEPASKRKAQNRESQRAFRARKAAKLTEMQAQVESADMKHKEELAQKIAELHASTMRVKELEGQLAQLREAEKRTAQERDFWKERSTHDQAQLQMFEGHMREQNYPMNGFADKQAVFFPTRLPDSRQDSPTRGSIASFTGYNTPTKTMDPIGCGNCKGDGDCACIAELAKMSNVTSFMAAVPLTHAPPRTSISPMKGIQVAASVDVYAEREFDFTDRFAKRARQVQRPSIAFITEPGESDTKCGFCTDDANCLCKDDSLRLQDMQQANDEVVPMALPETKATLSDATATGPGSCSDCQANPRQRAWCQRVAQLKNSGNDFLPSPTSRTSSIGSALETLEPRIPDASTPYMAKQSIGCSEAYKLFEGRVPMDQDRMEWFGNLKPVSPHARRDTLVQHTRKYSALELDTAGVIATLGNTMQPLQARPSDGENAHLVRAAQEHQRTTQSPRPSSDSPMPVSALINGTTASPGAWR